METTISYTEARNNLKDVIDTVTQDRTVVLIERRNGENAVLIAESDYRSLQETLYLLSNPVNAARLLEAKNRIPSEALPWEEAKQRLGL